MKPNIIIDKLEDNMNIFHHHLKSVTKDEIEYRIHDRHWCLLEIVCHLLDEERDDFRTRVFHTLEKPEIAPPPFNPIDWVSERNYIEQNYFETLDSFIAERKKSIHMLRGLNNPNWDSGYIHKKAGRVSASSFLSNWLAHDYLHLRQITKVKYEYLKSQALHTNLDYAGAWVL